ncbi:MAG: hypothetical protein IJS14_12810 [Lentisphaeria bacterium]|nr:hypothetical protein [Lentisphaeria bacterium]
MTFTIDSFGAVGDGKTLNTAAIQAAVDACAAAGGGTVSVPAGVYLTGTIFLKSNMTFRLESGAVLLGSPKITDYCTDEAYAQNRSCPAEGWCGAHLLVAAEQENVTLTGEGIIDGSCEAYFCGPESGVWGGGLGWARGGFRRTDPDKAKFRPGQMVVFVQCRNIRVSDLTLRNSPCWTCYFHGCRQVLVRGLTIDNPVDGQNTDGIDIDCCSQVTVSDCIIRTGDDGITLRASGQRLKDHPELCEDVAITNCVLDTSVCGFRIGVGNGLIRNVSISNIVIRYAGVGFLLQSVFGSKPRPGATMENIAVTGVRGRGVGHPVKISSGGTLAGEKIRHIDFSDFHTECCGDISIVGNGETLPDDISFRNCSFDVVRRDRPCHEDKRPKVFLELRQCGRIRFLGCSLNWRDPDPEWESACKQENVRELGMKDSVFPKPPELS